MAEDESGTVGPLGPHIDPSNGQQLCLRPITDEDESRL
jgi:hypothetical protein